jgi:hypothetical protein
MILGATISGLSFGSLVKKLQTNLIIRKDFMFMVLFEK